MDINKIISRFAVLSNLSTDKASDFIDICMDSLSYIEKITSADIVTEADISIMESAAAALSFYKYTLYLIGSGAARGFSAGDFSLDSSDSASDHALSLWMQAKKELAHLIIDKDFTFIAT